ncbi:MAG: DegQ family serine endoprotease [Thermodesulfobacteriota bacterium]|nr:DegQ family serine endoprotease [Thermodesulfobacteriota bacterium]
MYKTRIVWTTLLFLSLFVSSTTLSASPASQDWVADVAEQVLPSVVNISSTKTVQVQQSPLFADPFFHNFFRETPHKRVQRALGSGVIVTEDGFIITNNHVVGGADKVEVRLSDERVFLAKIIGADPKSDIALIKINADNLPAISIGDSSNLRTGSFVLAVGNPFGLSQTVTMGIISATGRSGLGITDYENFIQTDAAINPGNSGGALVNIKGELIGINTAILSGSGGNVGIGFAIPVNLTMHIKQSLIEHGKIIRGWVGVSVQEMTPKIATAMGLESNKGALVAKVAKDSPAQKAGIRQGDIILRIDNKEIKNVASMRFYAARLVPGSKIRIDLIRDGQKKDISLIVGDLSSAQSPPKGFLVKDNRFLKGARVGEINPAAREHMGIDNRVKGVLVIEVHQGSPAQSTGLSSGDIILEINGHKIEDLTAFKKIIESMHGIKISLKILRHGAVMKMTIIG